MRNVLVLAYYFPPCGGGGVMRVRSLVRHLPAQNWNPIVLTVEESYYSSILIDYSLIAGLEGLKVVRTKSLENPKVSEKALSYLGGLEKSSALLDQIKPFLKKVYQMVFIPDEKVLWLPYAFRQGVSLCKNHSINLIYATVPPHSSALIAYLISRYVKKPFVIDFRDDWVGNPFYESSVWIRNSLDRAIEFAVIKNAAKVISATEESRELFLRKYPNLDQAKFIYLPNGFDPDDFQEDIPNLLNREQRRGFLRVVYAGGLWRKRSPKALFEALSLLRRSGFEMGKIRVDFYGPYVQEFHQLSLAMSLDGIVKFHGNIDRKKLLCEIVDSDVGLVLISYDEGGATAIPGKVYEYIGLSKYVLALCQPETALANLVKRYHLGSVVPADDPMAIAEELKRILLCFEQGCLSITQDASTLDIFNRASQVRKIAEHFESACHPLHL